MKVYLATSGYPGEYGYQLLHAFMNMSDAEAYELADGVLEMDVHQGPVEVRPRYVVAWVKDHNQSPTLQTYAASFDDRPDEDDTSGFMVRFKTWDKDRAKAKHDEQFAVFVAERERRAAEACAPTGRFDVQVWYEQHDGTAVLRTPLHTTKEHFEVPRDRITDQAGLPRGETIHGRWFSVQTCTFTEVDGFSVCAAPNTGALAVEETFMDFAQRVMS